jgi:hypothetical protein
LFFWQQLSHADAAAAAAAAAAAEDAAVLEAKKDFGVTSLPGTHFRSAGSATPAYAVLPAFFCFRL